MARGYPKRQLPSRRKAKFDPADTENIKHTALGVWDLYEEINDKLEYIPGSSWLESYHDLISGLPYTWRMLRDIASIRSCWPLLIAYFHIRLLLAFLPALTLWFSAQLLNIVQSAVEERKVDKILLMKIAIGRVACSCVTRLFQYLQTRVTAPLNLRIRQYYSVHTFHAMARLDVPTFSDDLVQHQLERSLPTNPQSSIAWETVLTISYIFSTALQLISQCSVLVNALRGQQDGVLIAILCFAHALFRWTTLRPRMGRGAVWAATTTDTTYIRTEGMKRMVNDAEHRQEIVAGNLQRYLLSEFREGIKMLGDRAGDFNQMVKATEPFPYKSLVADILHELPQIAFTLRAVQYPASIPVSLASLHLITQTTATFTQQAFGLANRAESVADNVTRVKGLYEALNIHNQIADGSEPFPEDQRSTEHGISVEFRNVSFRYPGNESFALHAVSFRITEGQLCVIVGENGSGKSTILKLITRLYDPTEGEILINGRSIKSLKLEDLRRTISVLFQDYTIFPLSIKDNIGLGDPDNAIDEDMIDQAARLGGATDFVEKLPESFDTYLKRPVRDRYSALLEGTATLFGRPVDYGRLRSVSGMGSSSNQSLSGGQLQRIALSRMFMRSLASRSPVGLLLFDEPSASLDPTAEHSLFERLRQLRGNKTMIFSSHRFGNLTRHADLILYMSDSVVVEKGRHEDLLAKGGRYANLWKLQAQTFLP